MQRRYTLLIVLLILAGITVLPVFYSAIQSPSGCVSPLGEHTILKTELHSVTFGSVTEFDLPSPQRSPNAITTMHDGSVWFGEEAIPGIGHLYPNGTLVEYAFPGTYSAPSKSGYTCYYKTATWGIAIWDGKVWATDVAKNRLLGLDPVNDLFIRIKLPGNDSFPYTMTVGPDGALWFTQILSSQIGVLYRNGTVEEHPVALPTYFKNITSTINLPAAPAQIVFANSTLGYYVDVAPVIHGTPVFSFNPAHFSPVKVGGNETLYSPDSIALGDEGIWLAQHGASSIAYYNEPTRTWTIYPTSTVNYVGTTLPYFIDTNGSYIWFNEHYANRIAVIDFKRQSLTEYSVSDPPAANLSQIDNALTFSLRGDRAWFTEWTANRVGYVDASRTQPFSLSVLGNSTLTVSRGKQTNVQVDLRGNTSLRLFLRFSDSEAGSAIPRKIIMKANMNEIQSLAGSLQVTATIDVSTNIAPGRYMLLITATDGMLSRSAYVKLVVTY